MEAIDGVIASSRAATARSSAISRTRMQQAAAAQEFEQAALERNRLRRHPLAAGAPARRERGGRHARRDRVAVDGTDANAQVFQVRDGVLSDRQCSTSPTRREDELADVAEEFLLQYYGEAMSIPPQLVVQQVRRST